MDDILDRLFYGEVSPYDDSPQDIETLRELNHRLGALWAKVEAQATTSLKVEVRSSIEIKVCLVLGASEQALFT